MYSRLFILLQALWILPAATQPASAQVAFPPNFISPDVPHDLAAGPDASINALAVFAWSEFIALNWVAKDPATTGVRGRPDVNADFLSIKPDADGNFPLLVWHTYQHKNELFPASGQTLTSFDSSAPTYDYFNPPSQGKSFPLEDSQPTTPASLKLFNNLDETSEIGLANMFTHYTSSTDNIRIAYEAKANRAVFDYLNRNKFTTCPNQNCDALFAAKNKTVTGIAQYGGVCSTDPTIVSLPCGDANIAGDDGEGAIEVKAAWRRLTDPEVASGRFYTRKVIFYSGASGSNQLYNNAVYGLIALHIIHKTRSFPAFVFATWEQVDNYDDVANENTQDLKYINLSTPPISNDPVTRVHPIHSQVQPVNDAVHATFKAADPTTIWQYYKLIGVQAAPLSGPPVTGLPDDFSYYFLANIVVESNQTLQSFFGSVDGTGHPQKTNNVYLKGASGSPFQMGGCQGCHGFQGQSQGGDMSAVIANAPYTSNGAPDSIDAGARASIRSFLARAKPVRQGLGGSEHGKPKKKD